MRKSHVKYSSIVSLDVIERNYKIIVKNTKHKNKIVRFDLFHSININSIYNTLKNKNYVHGRYNIFMIKEPKYRVVMSENITDKVINHIVSNEILKPNIYPRLIEENVATRVGKGTNAAIEYMKKYFSRLNNKYEKFYILKFDIKKYFYNIDHDILKEKLRNIFTCKDILNLLDIMIDATDEDYVPTDIEKCIEREFDKICNLSNKNIEIKKQILKSIPHYSKGKGLGIGSLSNQIYAIFYLNDLDHFIKEKLKVKEYIRFMDDGVLLSPDIEYLKFCKIEIDKYLKSLKLELNDKTDIFTSNAGVDFVGYRFISKNGRMIVRLRNSTKKNMKRKFKNLSKYDKVKYIRVRGSYKGLVMYSNCKSLYKKYFR